MTMRLYCVAVALLGAAAGTSAAPTEITVSTNVTNPHVNKRWMGCHSDYGFAQTPRGFYANLVYNPSFANYGECDTSKGCVASSKVMGTPSDWHCSSGEGGRQGQDVWDATIATSTSSSSRPSVSIEGAAARDAYVANRGVGNAGLYLEAGKPYEFEAYVWQDASTTGFAELWDTRTNTSLARQEFPIETTGPPWGATWHMFNLTLTPSAAAECEAIPFGSDPAIDCGGGDGADAHVCLRCGGELRFGIAPTKRPMDRVAINVGYVSLMPGAWGRLADKSGQLLPVLKSGADLLTKMGVTTMRSGGSVSQSMRWKDWRGPQWNRPSVGQIWGKSFLAGWGPFEVIDMCAALDIEPIITLAYDLNDPLDWADLVEYCFGGEDTAWGKRRIADGHPGFFNVSVFELGNEQNNPMFVEQVAAMEERAKSLGPHVPQLHYMFPADNHNLDTPEAQAKAKAAGLPIERLMPDVHVGAGGAVEAAAALFAKAGPGFPMSAINCETNAGSHDLLRALNEAADLIDWFTADTATTDRLYARAVSFCTGGSSQFDSWDQGISFFLANMTWLQPPGHVHTMIKDSWADTTLGFSHAGALPGNLTFSAQRAGGSLVLRAVNKGQAPLSLTVAMEAGACLHVSGSGCGATEATVSTLSGTDLKGDNSPKDVDAIAPKASKVAVGAGGKSLSLTLPGYSFTVAVV